MSSNGAPPQVEFVDAAKLTTADYNPRRIEKRQLEALSTSLREDPRFFLQRPCLVNRRADGSLVVYAGNMRLAAAKANGQTMIPCLIESISKEQEQIRNLKDNNAYGEYVDAELAGLVYGLTGGLHPTTKPVGVFEIPMRVHTKVGELCYEPFAGSGSQLIAAERLQRRCYAMEIEPRFVDVARDRYAIFTREPKWAARPEVVGSHLVSA